MDWEAHGIEQRKLWSQLIADVWEDPALRARLVADPKAILAQRGLDVPEGVELKVMENTPERSYLTIPLRPSDRELTEEELGNVVGGVAKKPKPQPKGCSCGGGPNASCSPSDPRGTI